MYLEDGMRVESIFEEGRGHTVNMGSPVLHRQQPLSLRLD